jgi:hypothetical protein
MIQISPAGGKNLSDRTPVPIRIANPHGNRLPEDQVTRELLCSLAEGLPPSRTIYPMEPDFDLAFIRREERFVSPSDTATTLPCKTG